MNDRWSWDYEAKVEAPYWHIYSDNVAYVIEDTTTNEDDRKAIERRVSFAVACHNKACSILVDLGAEL